MVVADKLHVDAILGLDAMGGFGAVIDVAERNLELKGTDEVLPLWLSVVHEAYMTTMATSDDAIAHVEGATGLPPTLCVARSLGSVDEGKGVVDICNSSTDEY
ncbi:hypothetical protein PC121_g17919 [Phytophthora cactorum]|nr:hypothetical protein PC120_g23392 [Phytophthora cactorum]KAG3051355.1 hypothetical protein PC121_g17919 [Phytophthora cactorum]